MALPPRALRPSLAPTLTRALTRPRLKPTTGGTFTYLRPDGSSIFRPDGTSIYTRP
jgi:hypothetical protein